MGPSTELQRHGFGLPLSIGSGTSSTFGNVTAIAPDEPLPLPADMQDGEITAAERRAFDWKAAVFV
jgi:hypothetical protein